MNTKLFSHTYKPVPQVKVADPSKPTLHKSQKQAIAALKDKPHVILNAPTGWGKSYVIITLILRALCKQRGLRAIIAVPQNVIAPGFSQRGKLTRLMLRIGGRWLPWLVGYDLCDPQQAQRVSQVVDFLRGPNRTQASKVLLCTHKTLADTYVYLKRRKKLALLRRLTIWIDEAHHIKNAHVLNRVATVSNRLGGLLKYCVANGCQVGLATATFMRGDERHILPKELISQFVRFDVPYDDYLADPETSPTRGFQFHVLCDDTFTALGKLLKERRKTLLYIAKVNSRYSTGCKYATVESVLKLLEKQLKTKRKLDGPIITIGDYRVIDLVTERGRSSRQEYLAGNPDLDLIIALDTCKEGFDWTLAERSIIIGERKSIVETIQMIGRLFRRHLGQQKDRVDVYRIMPPVVVNKVRFKKVNDSRLNAVFEGMLLGEIFRPMSELSRKGGPRGHRIVEYFPNTDTWCEFQRAFSALAKDTLDTGGNMKDCFRYAKPLCTRFGVVEADHERVLNAVWRMVTNLGREHDRSRGKIIEVYKFADVVSSMVSLHTDLLGPAALKDYRKALGREMRTPEEWVPIAEKLARDNARGLLKGTMTYEALSA